MLLLIFFQVINYILPVVIVFLCVLKIQCVLSILLEQNKNNATKFTWKIHYSSIFIAMIGSFWYRYLTKTSRATTTNTLFASKLSSKFMFCFVPLIILLLYATTGYDHDCDCECVFNFDYEWFRQFSSHSLAMQNPKKNTSHNANDKISWIFCFVFELIWCSQNNEKYNMTELNGKWVRCSIKSKCLLNSYDEPETKIGICQPIDTMIFYLQVASN